MKYEKNLWEQLRSCKSKDLYHALKNDENWELATTKNAMQIFRNKHDGRNVSIHLHPTNKCGYGPKLIKELLEAIGWTEDELRKHKLIK